MNKLSILVLLLILIACNKKEQRGSEHIVSEDSVQTGFNIPYLKRYELLDEAIKKGDTVSYKKIAAFFILKGMTEDLLYCSLIMANKYDYPEAYYHVYIILSQPDDGKLLDERTKRIANYYLLKAKEKGSEGAYYTVKEIYGAEAPTATLHLD